LTELRPCWLDPRIRNPLAEITLHVEVPQLSFIQDDDPAVVRKALAAVHQARGMATRLALRPLFLRLQKSEGLVQNFIAQARRLARELTKIGVTVEDEDITVSLSLPEGSPARTTILLLPLTLPLHLNQPLTTLSPTS
jgi:hypothetical protein